MAIFNSYVSLPEGKKKKGYAVLLYVSNIHIRKVLAWFEWIHWSIRVSTSLCLTETHPLAWCFAPCLRSSDWAHASAKPAAVVIFIMSPCAVHHRRAWENNRRWPKQAQTHGDPAVERLNPGLAAVSPLNVLPRTVLRLEPPGTAVPGVAPICGALALRGQRMLWIGQSDARWGGKLHHVYAKFIIACIGDTSENKKPNNIKQLTKQIQAMNVVKFSILRGHSAQLAATNGAQPGLVWARLRLRAGGGANAGHRWPLWVLEHCGPAGSPSVQCRKNPRNDWGYNCGSEDAFGLQPKYVCSGTDPCTNANSDCCWRETWCAQAGYDTQFWRILSWIHVHHSIQNMVWLADCRS